jgi:redox-sensing transcriptional repressor
MLRAFRRYRPQVNVSRKPGRSINTQGIVGQDVAGIGPSCFRRFATNNSDVKSQRTRLDPIPAASVRRLSLYLRHLESLTPDHRTISSRALGKALGFTDAQVRKDFAHFGQFGHPGVGYRIIELVRQLKSILGTDRVWSVVMVGAGNLGHALAPFPGFLQKGFELKAVFDADPAKHGTKVGELEVMPMESLNRFVRERLIRLAIIAVPPSAAQDVVDLLIESGIDGILSFAPCTLVVPQHVTLNSVDLAAQLEQIVFAIQEATR